MKKFKFIFLIIILFGMTGCFNNDSMENITISTSYYPIEYIVKTLYGEHSVINSIYPNDSEVIDFKVTDVLLEDYAKAELFIFNGLSDEKNYIKKMAKNNKNLKIIDSTSNLKFDYSMEEVWLDPNNLLTIANNIKKGFEEYIKTKYLIDEINENYEKLKIDLTSLDGKFYSTAKKAADNTVIVSSNAFAYLKKYGINVISLDSKTVTAKDINMAKERLSKNESTYIFIKYGEEVNETIQEIIDKTNAQTIELYTLTNLSNLNIEKNDYITFMNENLNNLKLELYK